jgi:cyclopropane fatty-acyl-phospholipid synthase-like methyltransferase
MKDMRKLVEEGYDKGDYEKAFRKDDSMREDEKYFLSELTKHLPKKGKILDFGCGLGIPYDKYLAEKGFKVTGIDISQKHIDIAKKNVPKANYIKGDFSSYKFREKFSAIVSFYAIFHIPRKEHQKLFKKMNSLLKDYGVILITLGTSGEEYSEENNWAGAKMAWSQYDPETYRKMLDKAGFDIIEARFEGKKGDAEHHFWVLARKK